MSSRVPLRSATRWALTAALVVTGAAFCWPLLTDAESSLAGDEATPLLFALVLAVLVLIAIAQVSEDGLDAKTVAMLGVLSALGAALRPLGAGTGGIEPIFFLIILAGRAFGPGFGFVLGSTTLLTSAFITAGVGPWLPYQMMAAAWVGLGAGLLPRAEGRKELAMMAGYGAIASVLFGLLMNLSFWPFTLGAETSLSYAAGAPLAENLHHFLLFSLATSLGWDLGRALTTVACIFLLGPLLMRALGRAARRGAFDEKPVFEPTPTVQSTET